jgi:anti-sigma factor RsiW
LARLGLSDVITVKRAEALRFKAGDRFAAVYWVDDKHAYVVSGPAERAKLERISKMVYEQVDKDGAKKS